MCGRCLLAGNIICELNVFEHSIVCWTHYFMTFTMLISTLFQVCTLCVYVISFHGLSKIVLYDILFFTSCENARLLHMYGIDCNMAITLFFSCS